MKLAPALAVGLATVGASLLVAAPTAAADTTYETCIVTFQPWDQRQYHAAVQHADGTVQVIFAEQRSDIRLPPTDITIPADAIQVLWATRLDSGHNPANPDDYFPNAGSKLRVGPGCTFVDKYIGTPGKDDSVVIRPGTPATTTTSAAPTTTTEPAPTTTAPTPQTTFATTPLPSTTTTEQPPTGTTSSTVSIPTTTIEVDEPLQPEPTTTAPAPPPTVPVPSTTSTTSQVELFTATSVEQATGTLPHTGINSLTRFIWGVGCMAAGLILAIGGRACRRLQRARVQS